MFVEVKFEELLKEILPIAEKDLDWALRFTYTRGRSDGRHALIEKLKPYVQYNSERSDHFCLTMIGLIMLGNDIKENKENE